MRSFYKLLYTFYTKVSLFVVWFKNVDNFASVQISHSKSTLIFLKNFYFVTEKNKFSWQFKDLQNTLTDQL